jgi:hypothetical protein
MMSPASSPAFFAGESSLKSWTSTPLMSGKPTYSASFAVAFCTLTPMATRFTRPPAMIWSMTWRARSMGIAKP